MSYNQERKVRRQYEQRFGEVPWNLELDVVALTRILRQALRNGVPVDWRQYPQHPYDDWIDQDGNPV